jgi:signal transduction histidine kinase
MPWLRRTAPRMATRGAGMRKAAGHKETKAVLETADRAGTDAWHFGDGQTLPSGAPAGRPRPRREPKGGMAIRDPSWSGRRDVSGALLFPLQLRTVRTGALVTLLALVASAPAALDGRRTRSYIALLVATTAVAAISTFVPWKRLYRAGLGMRTQYSWAALHILLITLAVWWTGGARSYLFFLYAFPTVFFAVSFRERVQLYFLGFTFACYMAVLWVSGTHTPSASVLLSFAMLILLALLASFLAHEVKQQMAAHEEARDESERRWSLVAMVAAAARNMSTVDSRAVMEAVVDSIVSLGFETARIYLHDDQARLYRVVLPRQVPYEADGGARKLPAAVREAVLGQRRTLVIRDPHDVPDGPAILAELGVAAAVATPIVTGEQSVAVLMVGSSDPSSLSTQDVEVVKLLAAQAGLALENARGFAEERKAVERMAELDRLKSDFLSNVSHELRTPITVVTGMGLTLEQQWNTLDEGVRHELLARLNANAKSLDSIITRLLDFSRLEAGTLDLRVEEVSISELILSVMRRLDTLFTRHHLSVDADPTLVVQADRVLLERVMENLLANAAKYSPEGSHVLVSARKQGTSVMVSVIDDGPGMSAEEVQHLGERFYRGGDPNTRTTRGTGLGLALVSEILKLHQTKLEIYSKKGVGSRFAFRLPIRPKAEPVEPTPPPTEPVAYQPFPPRNLPGSRSLSGQVVARGAGPR